jgi:hypothetical protein
MQWYIHFDIYYIDIRLFYIYIDIIQLLGLLYIGSADHCHIYI